MHPGTEAMEREVFDMFGITFDGHPDLTRILMPEDWVGHPLRKDYASGRIPVQFKGAPTSGETSTDEHDRPRRAVHAPDRATRRLTSEGRQELASADVNGRHRPAASSWARCCVWPRPTWPTSSPVEVSDDETMIINMGPQHPSTHGVLRLMMELHGETVLRTKPIIGYLHTGMEWTGEELTYLQGCTNVTRMDYASPLFNELAFSLTVEKLLGIEVPDRAVWIRMLMTELNRISSHLLFLATNGMDLGAVSMMLYGWREREETLRFFEKVTGLRMNHNYIRPGGVAADLPDGWRDDVLRLLDMIPPRLDEYDTLLTGQPIWRERLQGVGVIDTEECIALGTTGPILRSTGYAWDLRRDMPYLAYDQVDFDVVVGTYGDCFDRYAIRLNEIRESIRIVAPDPRQDAQGRLPDPGQEGHAAAPGPHRRVDGGADPPLQDLHRGLQGARGRGLLRGRIASGRARVLHRVRWQLEPVPHAHPGPELREPADACPT